MGMVVSFFECNCKITYLTTYHLYNNLFLQIVIPFSYSDSKQKLLSSIYGVKYFMTIQTIGDECIKMTNL